MGENMFKAGNKVKYARMDKPATIISGPHPSVGLDRWLIEKADGNVSLVKGSELSEPLVSRADLVRDAIHRAVYYRPLDRASTSSREGAERIASAVLEALGEHEKAQPLAPGDRIRILKTGLEHADVERGDILTVQSVDVGRYDTVKKFTTDAPRISGGRDSWYFRFDGEGTGWERV